MNELSNNFIYTALGDDLSSLLPSFIFYGFPYRICRYFKQNNFKVEFHNFAKPKFTSNDLFFQLRSNFEIRQQIKKSNVLTLSIGANNLLLGVNETYTDINGKSVKKSIESFKEDWNFILYFIRNCIGSKATIYIMTIYNPFNTKDPNFTVADYYIQLANSIIKDEFWIKTYDYKIVDVYESFKFSSKNNFTFFETYLREPYPTFTGNKIIAEEFISQIKSQIISPSFFS
ncbi:hypothetical protein [Clostridium grantii]|uniref:Lysophospholipase L1 n=1 Tax=Clostridium grantii DSM 8605 TaxID=1121316 RepID=A0A1M5W091_9CLOT|nr:hypothetical protein [Clostridium grantii]SHH80838.1 Lysophospholipase L1 [Clostridium grantii DSM 8605]